MYVYDNIGIVQTIYTLHIQKRRQTQEADAADTEIHATCIDTKMRVRMGSKHETSRQRITETQHT